uniref:Fibrinogen C-terminal domain-containing protein n=1 Tax=Bicosoecida sp. CB-2014 TaxID=1486930 RepID=A0A7S1GB86_9STRA|mmetsp:Transcript_28034/g.96947  ORF Transcript_28034/g.96947 Transcript_28034/m.96947 type:complete len:849 (+) Transcript_28034:136-2682(+)
MAARYGRSLALAAAAAALLASAVAACTVDGDCAAGEICDNSVCSYGCPGGVSWDMDDFDSAVEWVARNGGTPTRVTDEKFHGAGAMYVAHSNALNFDGKDNQGNWEGSQTSAGFSVRDYPYLCMAYKVPATTSVYMLIGSGSGAGSGFGNWRTIRLNWNWSPPESHYTFVPAQAMLYGEMIPDNTWREDCWNLEHAVDAMTVDGATVEPPTINALMLYSVGSSSGELWLDSFRISSKPVLKNVECPATLPTSCSQILTDDSLATDGMYMIQPTGAGSAVVAVYCDMTTAGGGWTVQWVQPRPQNNLNYRDGYNQHEHRWISPELFTDTAQDQVLLAYRDAARAVQGTYGIAQIDASHAWRTTMFAEIETPGSSTGTVWTGTGANAPTEHASKTLKWGQQGFSGGDCAAAWDAGAFQGRTCIEGTDAPFFSYYAQSGPIKCDASSAANPTTTCTPSSFMTVAVRAGAPPPECTSDADCTLPQTCNTDVGGKCIVECAAGEVEAYYDESCAAKGCVTPSESEKVWDLKVTAHADAGDCAHDPVAVFDVELIADAGAPHVVLFASYEQSGSPVTPTPLGVRTGADATKWLIVMTKAGAKHAAGAGVLTLTAISNEATLLTRTVDVTITCPAAGGTRSDVEVVANLQGFTAAQFTDTASRRTNFDATVARALGVDTSDVTEVVATAGPAAADSTPSANLAFTVSAPDTVVPDPKLVSLSLATKDVAGNTDAVEALGFAAVGRLVGRTTALCCHAAATSGLPVAAPKLVPGGGAALLSFAGTTLNVDIVENSPSVTTRYTTDGSDPTSSSTEWPASGGLDLTSTTTVKVASFHATLPQSAVVSRTYTFEACTV